MKELIDLSSEERCGFQISKSRKILWNIELNIYLEFSKICSRHGLSHTMIYGSALGAIRHKGYIPWDDDLDVAMLREDFEKFIQVSKRELPDDYSIVYGIVDKQQFPLLRIRYKQSTAIMKKDFGSNHNAGVFIEVYVLDDIPNNDDIREKQYNAVENYFYLVEKKLRSNYSFNKSSFIEFIKLLPYSAEELWECAISECRKYADNSSNRVDCVQLPCYAKKGNLRIDKQIIVDTIDVPFETIEAKVMRNPIHLELAYKDYMSFPSIENRGKFHDRIIYFRPDRPYSEFITNQVVLDFFSGKGENPFF